LRSINFCDNPLLFLDAELAEFVQERVAECQ